MSHIFSQFSPNSLNAHSILPIHTKFLNWRAPGWGGGHELFVWAGAARKKEMSYCRLYCHARAGVKASGLGFSGQKFRFRFSKIGIENRNRNRFSIPIGQSSRQSESKIESTGVDGIDGNRHPVSIISLLVRGTRLGNHNLHLITRDLHV